MMDEWDCRSYCPTPTSLKVSSIKNNKNDDEFENNEKENEIDVMRLRANVPDTRTDEFEV